MYTLVGNPKNRSFRVLWMLEEIGVEYSLHAVAPGSDKAKAVNTSGKLPVLIINSGEDKDRVITDSVAIMQYLADKHSQLTATPGSIERAHQDSYTNLLIDDFDACLWTVGRHTFRLPEEMRIPKVIEVQKHLFTEAINNLEKRFSNNPYLMGEHFSVPDILLNHCLGWASRYEGFPLGGGKLQEYRKHCSDRPAYQRAHAIRKAS